MSPQKPLAGPPGRAALVLIAILSLLILFVLFQRNRIVKEPSNSVLQEEYAAVAPEEEAEQEATPVQVAINITESPAGEAIKRGDLEAAEEILRHELLDRPGDENTRSALAGVLNARALSAERSGNLDAAIGLLQEADTLSDDATIVKNLAAMLTRSGDMERAAEALEAIPNDPEARNHLKRIYRNMGRERYARGDIAGASEFLGKALEIDPSDAELKRELARAEGERSTEESMGTRDGSRFLVKFDGGENAVAGHLIGLLLEEAYIKVGSDLDLRPEGRVEALLYTRERFRDITRSPSWAGAIYDGRIKIPAGGITEKTSELEKVVFHEYTHAVVRDASKGRAPVWLNEGIAQYEEGRSSAEYSRLLSDVAGTGKVRLRALEGSFMGLKSDQAQIAYLLSLSATEYIIREFGLFSVRNILENLGKGMGMDEAISTALGLSYADLERSWLASLR
ncbi:MAG TPA: peptidase MA family metallohydrolase [Thermodesulfobacteriota bacterium]